MKRGDLIRVALTGDYGKPRPAVVVQADAYARLPSLTVLPLTSSLQPVPHIRVQIEPDGFNGLKVRSQIMVDKAHTISSEKAGLPFGRLSRADMVAVDRALIEFFDLASTLPHAGATNEPH
jgi:mRNA interferase MazF